MIGTSTKELPEDNCANSCSSPNKKSLSISQASFSGSCGQGVDHDVSMHTQEDAYQEIGGEEDRTLEWLKPEKDRKSPSASPCAAAETAEGIEQHHGRGNTKVGSGHMMSVDEVFCASEELSVMSGATDSSLDKGWMRFCAKQLQDDLRGGFGCVLGGSKDKRRKYPPESESCNLEPKLLSETVQKMNDEVKVADNCETATGRKRGAKASKSIRDSSLLSQSGEHNESNILKSWPTRHLPWKNLVHVTRNATVVPISKRGVKERNQARRHLITAKVEEGRRPHKVPLLGAARTLSRVKSERYKKAVAMVKESLEEQAKERWQLASEVGGLCATTDSREVEHRMVLNLERAQSAFLRAKRRCVSTDDFEVIRTLGRGAFGVVRLVRQKLDGKVLAIKQMSKESVKNKNQRIRTFAERDALAQSSFRIEQHVVKLYHTFQDDHHLYQVMEFLPGGDLMSHLRQRQCFSEDSARFYIAEIVEAVEAVHELGFVHRDLKPDNIVLDSSGHLKLLDFGLCKIYDPLAISKDKFTQKASSLKDKVDSAVAVSSSSSLHYSPLFESPKKCVAISDMKLSGELFPGMVIQSRRQGRRCRVSKEDKGNYARFNKRDNAEGHIGAAEVAGSVENATMKLPSDSQEALDKERHYLDAMSTSVRAHRDGERKSEIFTGGESKNTVLSEVFHPPVLKSNVGTPHYMAPEIYKGQGYTKSVDWWSVGIILFQCLYGGVPFNDYVTLNPLIIAYRVVNWPTYLILPHPSRVVSEDAVALLRGLLCAPEDRLTVEEIKRHPWFRGTPWGKLHTAHPPISVEQSPLLEDNGPMGEGSCLPSVLSTSADVIYKRRGKRQCSRHVENNCVDVDRIVGPKQSEVGGMRVDGSKLPTWAPHKALTKDFDWLNYTFRRDQHVRKPKLEDLLRDLRENEEYSKTT